MRVDPTLSIYHEGDWAERDFDTSELKQARFLLRRLRFLEARLRSTDNDGSSWFVLAELEVESLAWALGPEGVNYLADQIETGARA